MEARKRSKTAPPPFEVSLRIRHPSLDPAELSREFNIKPEHAFRAGDPRLVRSGNPTASVHTESYWLGALTVGSWPPDMPFPDYPKLQLAQERLRTTAAQSFGWALSLSAGRFLRLHAERLRRIRADGGEISLLVVLSPGEVGGFTVLPEVSRLLGEFGITVEFEFSQG